jgi:UDP-N-acetyl-D-galactosamine dehydrogenase
MQNIKKIVGIVGLGYVGLPLAIELSKYRKVIGFDVNRDRISQLKLGKDITLEVPQEALSRSGEILFTSKIEDLTNTQIYIVAVPTPVDDANIPDFSPLKSATLLIGKVLKKGDIVIFESTVYPGATEEVCVPILEQESNLKFNIDFYCGYSPERANPGDKKNTLTTIKKVTSGSNSQIASEVDDLYREVVTAGTCKVSSMKVAEATKIIENIQRDVNIALMNELSIICGKLGIDTLEVLKAAETKWNFLSFRPGLVGGHCIGVDPYYLTYKAEQLGYHPEIILAGRRINDYMAKHVAEETIKLMLRKRIPLDNGGILILGFTFKENCPDIRNTKVLEIYNTLTEYSVPVDIYDPWADPEEAQQEYSLTIKNKINQISTKYSAVIVAVGHTDFLEMGTHGIRNLCHTNSVIYDVKSIFPREEVDGRL